MPGDEEIKVTEILLDFAVQALLLIRLSYITCHLLQLHQILFWLCIYFGQCFTF